MRETIRKKISFLSIIMITGLVISLAAIGAEKTEYPKPPKDLSKEAACSLLLNTAWHPGIMEKLEELLPGLGNGYRPVRMQEVSEKQTDFIIETYRFEGGMLRKGPTLKLSFIREENKENREFVIFKAGITIVGNEAQTNQQISIRISTLDGRSNPELLETLKSLGAIEIKEIATGFYSAVVTSQEMFQRIKDAVKSVAEVEKKTTSQPKTEILSTQNLWSVATEQLKEVLENSSDDTLIGAAIIFDSPATREANTKRFEFLRHTLKQHGITDVQVHPQIGIIFITPTPAGKLKALLMNSATQEGIKVIDVIRKLKLQ